MSKLTEVIKAPNGTTSFIKPDFDVVLYEELTDVIIGRINFVPTLWDKAGTMLRVNKLVEGTNYDLALAPQPWYENLGDGILCWVEDKPIPLVVYKYDTGATNWPLKTGTGNANQFRIEECTPLTPEEAMKYTAKQ